MAHGTKDWGLVGPKVITYGLDDMAELAVRLGSIVNFDRRGDVMFLDDFHDGIGAWLPVCVGPGCDLKLSCGYAVSEPYSLLLRTGAGDHATSGVSNYTYRPQEGGVGLQASFMPVEHSETCRLLIYDYDGAVLTHYWAYYYHTTGTIEIYTEPATWVEVATPGVQPEGWQRFFTWKLVVDTETGKYERMLFNNQEYDLSDYTADHQADATVASARWSLVASVSGEHNIEPALDNVIITQNELIGD